VALVAGGISFRSVAETQNASVWRLGLWEDYLTNLYFITAASEKPPEVYSRWPLLSFSLSFFICLNSQHTTTPYLSSVFVLCHPHFGCHL
jgi:hypothetical protein